MVTPASPATDPGAHCEAPDCDQPVAWAIRGHAEFHFCAAHKPTECSCGNYYFLPNDNPADFDDGSEVHRPDKCTVDGITIPSSLDDTEVPGA